MTLSLAPTSRPPTLSSSLKPILFVLTEGPIASLIRACLSPKENNSLDHTNRRIHNAFQWIAARSFVHLIGFESRPVSTLKALLSFGLLFRSDKEFTLEASDADIPIDRLPDLIKRFKNITSLNLNGRQELLDRVFEALSTLKRIDSLNLSRCQRISAQSLSALLASLRGLRRLSLAGCPAITDQSTQNFKNLACLEYLDLSGTVVTGEGLSFLSNLPKLRTLSLPNTITDDSLAFLRDLPRLNDLYLSGCQNLTDQGLKHLEDLVQLKKLHLHSYNRLSNAGFNYLQKLSQLSALALINCPSITDEALESISYCFPYLEQLCIKDCPNITDRAIENLELLLVDANQNLTLNASSPDTDLDRALELVTLFINITRINFSGREELLDDDLLDLYPLKGLQTLNLSGCTGITNQGLNALLASLPQLRKLDLSFCPQIADEGVDSLVDLPELQDLSLADCSITDQSLQNLQRLTFLESLSLCGCNGLIGEGLSYLSTLSRLRTLSLPSIITDDSLVFLRGLPLLNALYLNGAGMLTDEGLKHLENLSQLNELHLECCIQISDKGINYLQNLSRLSFLNLTNCRTITDEALERISRYFPNLKILSLRDCPNISDRGLEHLHRLPLLEVLHVSSDLISDAAIQAFHDLRPNIVITRITPPPPQNWAVSDDTIDWQGLTVATSPWAVPEEE